MATFTIAVEMVVTKPYFKFQYSVFPNNIESSLAEQQTGWEMLNPTDIKAL